MIAAPHHSELAILARDFADALLVIVGLGAMLAVATGAGVMMAAIHVWVAA